MFLVFGADYVDVAFSADGLLVVVMLVVISFLIIEEGGEWGFNRVGILGRGRLGGLGLGLGVSVW